MVAVTRLNVTLYVPASLFYSSKSKEALQKDAKAPKNLPER